MVDEEEVEAVEEDEEEAVVVEEDLQEEEAEVEDHQEEAAEAVDSLPVEAGEEAVSRVDTMSLLVQRCVSYHQVMHDISFCCNLSKTFHIRYSN